MFQTTIINNKLTSLIGRKMTKKMIISLINSQNSDGSFNGLIPDPLATTYALGILRNLDIKYKDKKTIDWVLSLQTGNLGFGETTGEFSWDYTTYWGSMLHNYLDLQPKNKKHLIKFIYNHQTKNGGFTNETNGNTNLDSTIFFVSSLILFGESIKKKKKLIKYLKEIINLNVDKLSIGTTSEIIEIINTLNSKIENSPYLISIINKNDELFSFNKTLENVFYRYKIYSNLEYKKNNNLEFLLDYFNEDGGFSNYPKENSDLKSTFFATKLMKELNFNVDNKEKIIKFVLNHETKKGGFYNKYDKNTHACYCVINSLSLFGIKPLYLENLLSWLKYCQNEDGGFGYYPNSQSSEKATYWTLDTLNLLNRLDIIDENKLLDYTNRKVFNVYPYITYYIVSTLDILNKIPSNKDEIIKELLKFQNEDGGFGPIKKSRSEMYETFRAIGALNSLQDFREKKESIYKNSFKKNLEKWIFSCESKEGGYSWVPDERPYTQSTYHALSSLKILDLKINNIENHIKWILQFQNKDGGFNGGEKNTPSDTHFTFWALKSLDILSGIEK